MNTPQTSVLETMWKMVTENSNDPRLLQSWIEMNQNYFGEDGAHAALHRAADLPTSWLAKIWLTRLLLLEEDGLKSSLELYREALRLAPRKSVAVQEISGHLGEAGYFREAIDLLLPIYSAKDHGPWAGFNLFNACEDDDDLDSAQEVLNRMKAVDGWEERGSHHLKKIVRIRQEKLDILRDMDDAASAALN